MRIPPCLELCEKERKEKDEATEVVRAVHTVNKAFDFGAGKEA